MKKNMNKIEPDVKDYSKTLLKKLEKLIEYIIFIEKNLVFKMNVENIKPFFANENVRELQQIAAYEVNLELLRLQESATDGFVETTRTDRTQS